MKLRIEVCANDGRCNPIKVLLVSRDDGVSEVLSKAAAKLSMKKGKGKGKLYDCKSGKEVSDCVVDGGRYCVAVNGEDFVGGGGRNGEAAVVKEVGVESPSVEERVVDEEVMRLFTPVEGAGERLKANGHDDMVELLKLIAVSGVERPSHIWWTPQFNVRDRYWIAPGALRLGVAQLNPLLARSQLVEMRQAPYRMHLDIDVCLDAGHELYEKPIEDFLERSIGHIRIALGDRHRVLAVTGIAGMLRGRWKHGLHVYCDAVMPTEQAWIEEVRRFRDELRKLDTSGWAGAVPFEDKIVDEMTGGGFRLLGSPHIMTCKQCRKRKVVDPKCTWCFGQGMEPERIHRLLIGSASDCSIYSLDSSSSLRSERDSGPK